jgi:hypothetical protein
VHFRGYRPLGGKLCSVTFRRKAGKWHVSAAWDRQALDPRKIEAAPIGIDRGVAVFAATSVGQLIDPLPHGTVEVERRVERFVSHVMDAATAAPGELVQIDRRWMLRLGEDLAELYNNRELKREIKERTETLSRREVHGEDAAVDFLVALGYTFT